MAYINGKQILNVDFTGIVNIDQTYNPESKNPQSGKAVASALVNYLPLNAELQLELDGGDAGGTLEIEYIVDNAMSDTSPNAVENRVIKQYIDGKTENIANLENDVKTLEEDVSALDKKHTADVSDLQADINVLDEDTSKLKTDVAILEPIQNHRMFGSSYNEIDGMKYYRRWYYVDNVNGDDTYQGNSWTKAFKTLKKALDTANIEGNHDTRIRLLESSTPYEFPYATCAIDCLHISGFSKNNGKPVEYATTCNDKNSPPVTIQFTDTNRPNAFYCGRINFQGIKFVKNNVTESGYDTKFYSDGGAVLFECCELDAKYGQYGGTLQMIGCYISQLVCRNATVDFAEGINTFNNNNINNTIEKDFPYKLYVANSMFIVEGKLDFNLVENNINCQSLIYILNSTAIWESDSRLLKSNALDWSGTLKKDVKAAASIFRIHKDALATFTKKDIQGCLCFVPDSTYPSTYISGGEVKNMKADGTTV